MLLNPFRYLFNRLTATRAKSALAAPAPAAASLFEFDPMWHGDHWQNLLSSPMDARRYVMEDWSVPTLDEWSEAARAVPAH
nr:hypothetical protein [Paraburkholderia sp. BCC1886]